MVDDKVCEIVDKGVDNARGCDRIRGMREVAIPDDEDMVPGLSHAMYLAINRMARMMREAYRGDNHDAERLEEEEVVSPELLAIVNGGIVEVR